MPWPVTFSNGNVWQESQFAGFAYVQNFPGILQDVVDEATRVIGQVGTAKQLAAAMQAGPVANIQRRGRPMTGVVALDPADASIVLPSISNRLQPGFAPESGAFGRASIGTYTDPRGVLLTAASGAPRYTCEPATGEPLGMLLEGARTNYILNSAAPATQTISLVAATYTLWVVGSGSATLSGGPTGTATQGSPVTFTLGTTTSVTITVSGALTRFQVENGSTVSSFIETTTASVTRASDGYSYALPADLWNTVEGTIVLDAVAPQGIDTLQQALEFGDGSANNRLHLSRNNARQALLGISIGGTVIPFPSLGSWPDLARQRIALTVGGGTCAASMNGAAPLTANVSNMPPATVMRVGFGATTNRQWFGAVSLVQYIPRRVANATLPLMSTI